MNVFHFPKTPNLWQSPNHHQHESTIIQNSNHQMFNGLFASIMPCKSQKQCNLPTPLTKTQPSRICIRMCKKCLVAHPCLFNIAFRCCLRGCHLAFKEPRLVLFVSFCDLCNVVEGSFLQSLIFFKFFFFYRVIGNLNFFFHAFLSLFSLGGLIELLGLLCSKLQS